ncbi:MAG: hypothetical protein NC111_06430 [Bacteroides sp.]|nr:hypothetical protein [Bacteroides sp.]MCM1413116.1 hypothetical protein [Bacteroides sp.]MCM1472142.1 hypothetical protein [Bacteroides sp.]
MALGCIHLQLDDFVRLTVEEFDAIYEAYREDREANYRNTWEQMRTHAAITVSPHVKRSPTPQRLLPLPWDKTKEHRPKADDPIISKEEALERFKQRIKKNG